MFRDLTRAFAGLFTERRSRLAVIALLLTMAAIPVAELGVIRTFSQIIIKGPREFDTHRSEVVRNIIIFFVGFGITRALHHLVRFWRVRVFRKGFHSSGLQRTHGTASWEWAQGFELSVVSVGLIQVLSFSLLFFWINAIVGAFNAFLCAVALYFMSRLYRRQLAKQFSFAEEGMKPGSTAVSERIATRVFAAEFGSMIATASMAVMMFVVLWRVLANDLSGADGVVLFLGLRLLYGHLGALAPSLMRFARDSVRRHAARARAEAKELKPPPVDEGAVQGRRARLAKRRGDVVTQMIMAGQRGELQKVQTLAARLERTEPLNDKELGARHVAESFAEYAAAENGAVPLPLIWWPRPFPGNFGNWLSPLVLRRLSGQPVTFQPPTAPTDAPNLIMVGSIGRFIHERSIVVGTGVARPDTALKPDVRYVSVRGPLTADIVRRSGGPTVESFGDPGLLLPRILPMRRDSTNGRLALVRHFEHREAPVTLPEGMDEHSVLASGPDEIAGLVETLCGYDGVVTSDMHVMIACHAYGIPCSLVCFEGLEETANGADVRYRDYSLGAELAEVWEPETVGLDLTKVNWPDRLRVETVDEHKLDEIEAAIQLGVQEYGDALEAYLDEIEDDTDDDDG